jgi:hypothetical protein
MHATALFLLCVPSVAHGGSDSGTGAESFPGERLAERLEAHMKGRAPRLRLESLEHYALLYDVDPADVARWMEPVSFQSSGDEVALGAGHVVELHGGAILAFLLEHWRPESRHAGLADRYFFVQSGRSLPLGVIYASHRRQIFLPVPGRAAGEIRGALPGSPQLARMRFRVPGRGGGVVTVERDAYSFLRLLVSREDDFAARWVNDLGQDLSVDLLMRQAWDHYLAERSVEDEAADHSNLHLVEILLTYRRRAALRSAAPASLDPNAIKRRFLAVELARGPTADDERLGHYAESLGWLLADPEVTWDATDQAAARAWLRSLEEDRFHDLAAVKGQFLAHLLRGLRTIAAHRDRLESGLPPPSKRDTP